MDIVAITVFIIWVISILINLIVAWISKRPFTKDEKLMTALLILAGPLTIALIIILFFTEPQDSYNERN